MNTANTSPNSVLNRYEPVIGLEVHCQLATESKLFCSCSTAFGQAPNHHVCPVCLGTPGALPVLNRKAVDFGLKMARAIEAEIAPSSEFSRKQYFYPDLPKGFQISQYDKPYCSHGKLTLSTGRTIRILRIHFEEDAGKSVHEGQHSFVDLNRAGTPLIEIVSEPDLRTAEEASEYVRRIQSLVRYLAISDGNLEEGSLRCDVNISLRPRGQEALGTKCEIKNLNSFKNIERAIQYEILRQSDLLDEGQKVQQATLLFDASSGKTQVMRFKEDSEDYRYFPEPDLPLVIISPERLAAIDESMPELPTEREERFVKEFGLSAYDASYICQEKLLADYFETIISLIKTKTESFEKLIAHWLMGDFMKEYHSRNWDMSKLPVTAAMFAELMEAIFDQTISQKIAKKVFATMAETPGSPRQIIADQGLVQVTDLGQIRDTISAVLDENPEQLQDYLGGKEKIYGFFVGQIMKRSGGKFNPGLVNEWLKKLINDRRS